MATLGESQAATILTDHVIVKAAPGILDPADPEVQVLLSATTGGETHDFARVPDRRLDELSALSDAISSLPIHIHFGSYRWDPVNEALAPPPGWETPPDVGGHRVVVLQWMNLDYSWEDLEREFDLEVLFAGYGGSAVAARVSPDAFSALQMALPPPLWEEPSSPHGSVLLNAFVLPPYLKLPVAWTEAEVALPERALLVQFVDDEEFNAETQRVLERLFVPSSLAISDRNSSTTVRVASGTVDEANWPGVLRELAQRPDVVRIFERAPYVGGPSGVPPPSAPPPPPPTGFDPNEGIGGGGAAGIPALGDAGALALFLLLGVIAWRRLV